MKAVAIGMAFLVLPGLGMTQLKTTTKCPDIVVDILDGIVNGTILPTSTVGYIKKSLPCFSSFEEVGTAAKCGAVVFYKDKDVYFYTDRNYIEIRSAFKGKLSIPLMGASRSGLFKWLGPPEIKEATWDAFQTSYGILILYYNTSSRVNKIQFSTQSAGTIHLCE